MATEQVFLGLTGQRGRKILIDVSKVMLFEDWVLEDGTIVTRIIFMNGSYWYVIESINEILERLQSLRGKGR